MRRLVILCLILCIIKLSYCDDNEDYCEQWYTYTTDVILLEKEYPEVDSITHYAINKRFANILDKYGIKSIFKDTNGKPLKTVLEEFNDGSTIVIYLYVTDFYQYAYNDILERNFMLAGNVEIETKNKTRQVCRNNATNEIEPLKKCEESSENQNSVKLVSKTILKHQILHELVKNFDGFTSHSSKVKHCVHIVVCDDNISAYYIMERFIAVDNRIRIVESYDCKNDLGGMNEIPESTLAVLTLRPFKFNTSEKLYTPTIFYDYNYMPPETTDSFVNGFSVINEHTIRKRMKFAFLQFLQKVNWERVGVISDNSVFSQEFERDFTSLLEQEHFMYASRSHACVGANCDFSDVFKQFAADEARVIIANIGEGSADIFAKQVANSTLAQRPIVWLVRAWSPKVSIKAARDMGDIFSITLGPKLYPAHNFYITNEYTFMAYPLKFIYQFLKDSKISSEDIRGFTNQRKYAEKMKNIIYENVDIFAYVKRYKKDWAIPYSFVAEIADPAKYDKNFTEFYNPHDIHPELKDCKFKRNVYFKPCYDNELKLLVIVCYIFLVISLGTLYFYKSYKKSYSRMPA